MPVGSPHEVEVNARVVAATNRDIEAEVKDRTNRLLRTAVADPGGWQAVVVPLVVAKYTVSSSADSTSQPGSPPQSPR